MPRYYFRLTDGAAILENHKGIDLSRDAAARDDAIALARHLKHGDVMQGWNWRGWFVNIIDAHGHKSFFNLGERRCFVSFLRRTGR